MPGARGVRRRAGSLLAQALVNEPTVGANSARGPLPRPNFIPGFGHCPPEMPQAPSDTHQPSPISHPQPGRTEPQRLRPSGKFPPKPLSPASPPPRAPMAARRSWSILRALLLVGSDALSAPNPTNPCQLRSLCLPELLLPGWGQQGRSRPGGASIPAEPPVQPGPGRACSQVGGGGFLGSVLFCCGWFRSSFRHLTGACSPAGICSEAPTTPRRF